MYRILTSGKGFEKSPERGEEDISSRWSKANVRLFPCIEEYSNSISQTIAPSVCVNTSSMEAKLSTCFLNGGCYGGGGTKFNQVNVRFSPMPSRRLLPASCKMRQRNFGCCNFI